MAEDKKTPTSTTSQTVKAHLKITTEYKPKTYTWEQFKAVFKNGRNL